jgi:hypothetical protein
VESKHEGAPQSTDRRFVTGIDFIEQHCSSHPPAAMKDKFVLLSAKLVSCDFR